MRVTFIQPSVGRKPGGAPYPSSWCMEPLAIAALSALTPPEHERVFHDDRLEVIPFDAPTDLACLSVETYTARRSYQIAEAYRRRGVPVVLGGFHPTLVPEEAERHAEAIVVGEAEGCWADVLADAAAGRLQRRYTGDGRPSLIGLPPANRAILGLRRYGPLSLVETSRGCAFCCEFCSISAFFRKSCRVRPVPEVAEEVSRVKKNVFFVDDNIGADPERLGELCRALLPLGKRWVGQVSLHIARDESLLALMRASGCAGVLIGFESLDPRTLSAMGKRVNAAARDYDQAVAAFRRHGLAIYATFVFGYDEDTPETFERVFAFALRHRFFFTAFNHLVPFPGTPLYGRLRAEGRLLSDAWWLDPRFRFGDVVFRPSRMTPVELARLCDSYRGKFYAPGSVLRRAFDGRANCGTPFKAALFLAQNFGQGREVAARRGLPWGLSG